MREAELTRALVATGGLWSSVRVVSRTGSTNADVAALARSGAPHGLVLIAEEQTAGRGRSGRSWQSPPGTGLTMSVLLRPESVAAARFGWLPLLTGVAVARSCARLPGVQTALKWPNDVLVRAADPFDGHRAGDWGKCGGILAEAVDPSVVVVGIGINVSQREAELPPPSDPLAYPPTSLALVGAVADREGVAIAVLRELDHWYGRWYAAGGDPLACGLWERYRDLCSTIGHEVTVTLPGGVQVRGVATGIDSDGRLGVTTTDGERFLAAGDVHHVRAPGPGARSAVDAREDAPVQPRARLASAD